MRSILTQLLKITLIPGFLNDFADRQLPSAMEEELSLGAWGKMRY